MKSTLTLLADCFPAGSPSNSEGTSSYLVNDLIALAEIEAPDAEHFMTVAFKPGGFGRPHHLCLRYRHNKEQI